MSNFNTKTVSRRWMLTVNIENMKKIGIAEDEYLRPDVLAAHLSHQWNESGKGRTCAVAVCKSAEGLYHAHMVLFGNTTTLHNVAKVMFDSHTEPLLNAEAARAYILKEPPYDEKGEEVLYSTGIEEIKTRQGERTDLEQIECFLQQGMTPREIMEISLAYRRYEKMIKSAYLAQRIKETPIIKETANEWHFGPSGTGKTYLFARLCEELGEDNVYFCNDLENGGFDMYLDCGAPPVLFIDELKPGGLRSSYKELLNILDCYSRAQTHCRYANTYNLWTRVIITSVYSPEAIYQSFVDDDQQRTDSFGQLLRRLKKIVYHYKDGEHYRAVEIMASQYENADQLINMANGGFSSCEEPIPFE